MTKSSPFLCYPSAFLTATYLHKFPLGLLFPSLAVSLRSFSFSMFRMVLLHSNLIDEEVPAPIDIMEMFNEEADPSGEPSP